MNDSFAFVANARAGRVPAAIPASRLQLSNGEISSTSWSQQASRMWRPALYNYERRSTENGDVGRPLVAGHDETRKMEPHVGATVRPMLRCLQCGNTFTSLPQLTMHMIQSAHYANLIRSDATSSDSVDGDDDDDDFSDRDPDNCHPGQRVHPTAAADVPHQRGAKLITDRLRPTSGKIWRPDAGDDCVSPARSLDDDESLSSAGVTELDSASADSPTSPLEMGKMEDGADVMPRLLQLHPLLTGIVPEYLKTAVHPAWLMSGAGGLPDRRQRQSQASSRVAKEGRRSDHVLPPQPLPRAADVTRPIDLRSRRRDGYSGRLPPFLQNNFIAASSLPPATAYLDRLLFDAHRDFRFGVAAKKSGTKRCSGDRNGANGRLYASKKQKTLNFDAGRAGSARLDVTSTTPSSRRFDNSTSQTPATGHDGLTPQRQQSSKDALDLRGGAAESAGQQHADPVPSDRTVTTGADSDERGEYAARFGKYYRLARELSNRSD